MRREAVASPASSIRPLGAGWNRKWEDYPFTRTYIKAAAEPRSATDGPFWAAADRARQSPAWRYREIASSHMVATNRPDELARLLLELA